MFLGNRKKNQDRKRSQGVDGANEDDVYVGAYGTFEGILLLRRQLRQTQKGALCLSLANLVLLCALLCCFLLRPEPVYFGMSRDMKLLPMTPLSEPILNEAALKN